MEEAAELEKQIAISKGRVDPDGTPYITVIVDGGWSHRSHGHRYSAKSGCACIIGKSTKKLLYMGVKNKFCWVCSKYEGSDQNLPKHNCFLNYAGASTGMESQILLEGFRYYESKGLKFKYLIGDGDSSVYKTLSTGVKYGYEIEKIECANHSCKNYTKALYNVRKAASNAEVRILTAAKIHSLKVHARWSIARCVDTKTTAEELRKELLNGPCHVFGHHEKCFLERCHKAGTIDKNAIDLKNVSYHLFAEIMAAVNILANKANRLVTNNTTNLAETFMSLVARFSGGKQINRSNSGGYHIRCQAAGLDYQNSAQWLSRSWKTSFGNSPSTVAKKYIRKQNRKREMARKRLYTEAGKRRCKKRILKRADKPDKYYGPNAQEPDISASELEKRSKEVLHSLSLDSDSVKQLESLTKLQYNSALWKKERRKRITSSMFGQICKRKETTSCKALVKAIICPKEFYCEATAYGQKYENEAKVKFSEEFNLEVSQAGLCVDEEHGFIAASPDGFIESNGLIEVKCPYSARNISPQKAASDLKNFPSTLLNGKLKLKRNHNYFYQVQGQLHITRREICYFVTWTPQGIAVEKIYRDDKFWEKMFPKLKHFYATAVLPELVDSRLNRSMEIREPDHVLLAQEKKKRFLDNAK